PKLFVQMVGKTAGELEYRLLWDIGRRQRRVAAPADLYAREEIGLGPGQLVESLRAEFRIRAKDFRIGGEGNGRAPAVGRSADFLERRRRDAFREGLPVEL